MISNALFTLHSSLFTYTAGVLLLAWFLDLCFGDPARLPHPIVYMGKWIAMGERHLNRGDHRKFKGALFALVSIGGTYTITYLILSLFTLHSSLFTYTTGIYSPSLITGGGWGVGLLFLFFCLAGHTLRKEVRMVFEALEESLDRGRQQVARIVGRDTQNLSAQEVRTAALETLAENLSDGVIAPLFWFMVLGVPGAMAYKMVNTLDSMIGYQNERYKDFGCWAAHIDDIANYIPARLTALLILVANALLTFRSSLFSFLSSLFTFHFKSDKICFLLRYAGNHASPNSGWPEAALAAILDCRFGGTHNYFGKEFYKPHIGEKPRELTYEDMTRSIHICLVAEVIAVIICITLLTI